MNLGKHGPIIRVLREGIIRVQFKVMQKLANEPVDDWFSQGIKCFSSNIIHFAPVALRFNCKCCSTGMEACL